MRSSEKGGGKVTHLIGRRREDLVLDRHRHLLQHVPQAVLLQRAEGIALGRVVQQRRLVAVFITNTRTRAVFRTLVFSRLAGATNNRETLDTGAGTLGGRGSG